MAEAVRFDWPGLMRLGLRGLGLQPRQFWALTPAELMLLLGQDGGRAPMGRTRLHELAQAFPDLAPPDTGMVDEGETDG